MKKQEVMWTALPKGVIGPDEEGTKRLRLSVFVSPRLQTNEGLPRPILSQFPDFLDWPATVEGMEFSVQFAGRPPVAATRVLPPNDPSPSQLWQAIFKSSTYVEPYEFPDLSQRIIHSFPVRNVMSRLKETYQTLAIESPTRPPRLRGDETGVKLRGLMQEIVLPPEKGALLDTQMSNQLRGAQVKALSNPMYIPRATLRGTPPPRQGGGELVAPPPMAGAGAPPVMAQHLVSPEISQATLDFHQVQTFHRPATLVHTPMPLPRELVESIDFHQIVASLGEFPELMQRLGLAIDLEIPFDAGLIGAAWVKVVPTWTPQVAGSDVTPRTHCVVSQSKFQPQTQGSTADMADGMLKLNDPDLFEIGQMDVDGAAMKTLDLAEKVVEEPEEEPPAQPPPAGGRLVPRRLSPVGLRTTARFAATPSLLGLLAPKEEEVALPATRSAGLWVAKVDRGVELAQVFLRAKVLNLAVKQQKEDELSLYAEDLVRGYRIDIWDNESERWHSLCQRTGTYRFEGIEEALTLEDEGCVSTAATSSPDGAEDLYLHEVLFRWEGWSLSAPRPGKAVEEEGAPAARGNEFGLQTEFAAKVRSLPRLRFGQEYRLRARVVDLAGNSLSLEEADDSGASEPVTYFRYEPLNPPTLIPRNDMTGSPGESLQHLVIRSYNDTPDKDSVFTPQICERHVAPPPTSQLQAETHGMFDGPEYMRGDAETYQMIVAKDQTLAPFFDVPEFEVPYLPDPLAYAVVIRYRTLHADSPREDDRKLVFTGTWPELRSLRLVMYEHPEGKEQMDFNRDRRILRVPVRKGEVAEVTLTCSMKEQQVPQMGMWRWAVEGVVVPTLRQARIEAPQKLQIHRQLHEAVARPQVLNNIGLKATQIEQVRVLGEHAKEGRHWLLTPGTKILLVHAVQQPLIKPEFQTLTASKSLGETFALLSDELPIDGKSTTKVELKATWQEPLDPVTRPTWRMLPGTVSLPEWPVAPDDKSLKIENLRHEFGDTKYRRVSYTAMATTRFREYLGFADEQLESGEKVITRTSEPLEVDVLNSARPAAPQILYVLPTFGWEKEDQAEGVVSKRTGGGLRVYLERPWFSSGEGELLGVVLAQPLRAGLLTAVVLRGQSRGLEKYVTQWGADPLWRSTVPTANPTGANFTQAQEVEADLTLEELPGVKVSVAGHEVHYDQDRRLWYCDLEMDIDQYYYPFIRLALARYQPKSVKTAQTDVKLSRVVQADFAQLAPDRTASITWNTRDQRSLRVTVSGSSYTASGAGTGPSQMEVAVETRAPEVKGDLGWTPVPDGVFSLQVSRTRQGPTVWSGDVNLPEPRGTKPFRLVIKEYELFAVEGAGARLMTVAPAQREPKRRLVYADSVEL